MKHKFLAIGLALLLVTLSFGFFGCGETCQCGQWVGITVSSGDWQETAACGETIYTPTGVEVVEVSANYFCEPRECEATYEWQVSAAVAVVDSGSCDTSPCAFEFELPDACVEVSVSAYCGGTLCDECTFTICPGSFCECGEWGVINVSSGSWQETVECNGVVYTPPDVSAVEISANYLCEPRECEATYEWQVSTAVAFIGSGSCDASPCAFEFELSDERVEVSISAYCGDTLCDECFFLIYPYGTSGQPPGQDGQDGQEPGQGPDQGP